MSDQSGVRIDRSLAKSAVEGGKVHVDQQRVKPAKEVHSGQTVRINKDGVIFTVQILELSEQRGSATIAQTLYCETPDSIEERQIAVSERRMARAGLHIPAERPNKRDRRARNQLRALDQQWSDEESAPPTDHPDN